MTSRLFTAVLVCLALGVGQASAAAPDGASQTDQLLFSDRDWSGAAQGLNWSVDSAGPQASGFRPIDDGQLLITDVVDPKDGHPMLQLREVAPGRDRIVGTYSRSVDPMLIYFLETATRNMASIADGNPNYIRNRIKAEMRSGGDVVSTPDGGHTVTLSPFVNDPNAARMGGFGTMTLVFTLGPDDHAPIRALRAAAPTAGYHLNIVRDAP